MKMRATYEKNASARIKEFPASILKDSQASLKVVPTLLNSDLFSEGPEGTEN